MKLNKKKFISSVSLVLLVILFIIFGISFIFKSFNSNSEYKKMNLNFSSRINKFEEFISNDYYKIGWLQVQGTNIDVPILDARSSNIDLSYSFGWRSSTYTTGENREVLLGHNVLNVSNQPMLSNEKLQDFESLMSFSYYKFAKDNLYIQYTKNGKDELYLIYAISFYDYTYDNSESISDSKKIKEYINDVRKNSIYDYDVEVDSSDTLITVKTCTRYFGLSEKQQFIIDARKVRDNEEIVKYSVKTNDNFEKLINSSEMN